MRIPKQFTLHGHTINVREVEKMESNSYGEYNDVREKITVAHKVRDDEGLVELTQEQIEHSFWHEERFWNRMAYVLMHPQPP